MKAKTFLFFFLYRSIVPRVLGQIKRLITTWRRGFYSTPWNCSTSGMEQYSLQSPIRKRKVWVYQKTHSPLSAVHHSFVFSKYWFLDHNWKVTWNTLTGLHAFVFATVWFEKRMKRFVEFWFVASTLGAESIVFIICSVAVWRPQKVFGHFWTTSASLLWITKY